MKGSWLISLGAIIFGIGTILVVAPSSVEWREKDPAVYRARADDWLRSMHIKPAAIHCDRGWCDVSTNEGSNQLIRLNCFDGQCSLHRERP